MYVKLVVGNTALSALSAMRDICRLLTSTTPSISDIGAFNTSSSIVIDNTPAGWTYVGSTNADDRPTIASTTSSGTQTADVNYQFICSAPCINSSKLKYMVLTNAWRSPTNQLITITGATSATNLGVVTNEGPRLWQDNAGGSNGETLPSAFRVNAGDTLHLIANPRHVTIVHENRGLGAIWESTQTDINTFYDTAPFVQYSHYNSSAFTRVATVVPLQVSTTQTATICVAVFGITDPNTGTFYGTYDLSENLLVNNGNLVQTVTGQRANTINTNGSPRYVANPIFYGVTTRGYPIQYVTGLVDAYWVGAGIGVSGDLVDINGDSYTFFNCGTGYGIAMKTD